MIIQKEFEDLSNERVAQIFEDDNFLIRKDFWKDSKNTSSFVVFNKEQESFLSAVCFDKDGSCCTFNIFSNEGLKSVYNGVIDSQNHFKKEGVSYELKNDIITSANEYSNNLKNGKGYKFDTKNNVIHLEEYKDNKLISSFKKDVHEFLSIVEEPDIKKSLQFLSRQIYKQFLKINNILKKQKDYTNFKSRDNLEILKSDFNSNGEIKSLNQYIFNSQKEGVTIDFHSNGMLKNLSKYKNGKLIEGKEFSENHTLVKEKKKVEDLKLSKDNEKIKRKVKQKVKTVARQMMIGL